MYDIFGFPRARYREGSCFNLCPQLPVHTSKREQLYVTLMHILESNHPISTIFFNYLDGEHAEVHQVR